MVRVTTALALSALGDRLPPTTPRSWSLMQKYDARWQIFGRTVGVIVIIYYFIYGGNIYMLYINIYSSIHRIYSSI